MTTCPRSCLFELNKRRQPSDGSKIIEEMEAAAARGFASVFNRKRKSNGSYAD